MFRIRLVPFIAAIITIGPTLTGTANAADARVGARYSVSVAGFPVASGTLSMIIQDRAYSMQVGMRTSGVGRIAFTSRGSAKSIGWLADARVKPAKYTLNSVTNKKPSNVDMSMKSGAIRSLNVRPKLKKRPDRVPVTKAHRRGVLDPVSAILMPLARTGTALNAAACNRTLPIFDGWTRYDIRLSYKETRKVSFKGYAGSVVVCKARWVPVAGHRPARRSVKYLQNNRDMDIWLAPIGQLPYLVPLRASIRTKAGPLVVEARNISMKTGRLAQAD